MTTTPAPAEKPSPTTAGLRKGLARCRAAYPAGGSLGPWPALTRPELWRQLAERWESALYGMTDEVFLQAVEDHITGPYKEFCASPGHLWVAVDLRREADGRSPDQEPLPAPERQQRVAGYMEEIRKQIGGRK